MHGLSLSFPRDRVPREGCTGQQAGLPSCGLLDVDIQESPPPLPSVKAGTAGKIAAAAA